MAKISLKKDYMDGNVLYGKDLNPNFETIETTINANDDAQAGTNAEVEEALTQLSSDMSQAKTDISGLQEDVADLETAALNIPTKTSELENDSGFVTEAAIPTKISQLENDDNTVKDADYVHTDNNYTDEDKTKLANMTEYELPVATSSTLGGVMIGQGLNIGSNGSISLGTASDTQLGGVKAGDGVQITADGSLNVIGGSTGDGIPTLTGTQEEPILLYNCTVGDNKVPTGLAYISGYTKETTDSDVNDNFDGYLLYTDPNAIQLIGPAYEPSADYDLANLCFYFRPMLFDASPGFLMRPFVKYEANYTITNTKQGYVTPKAVYDYVGALSSLNTEDKSSIVNAINELVNSTGGDGLDYLGFKGNIGLGQTPVTGQTFTNDFVYFTRTPVVGDVFVALGLQVNGPTYLIDCEVTEVTDTNATYKIVAFTNTQGEEGPRGVQGNPGPQGDPGPAGADGITPTIGENGNWYLGETDTGKPSRGEKGEQGAQGLPGPTGPGVPTGGTTGQVLSKTGDGDYETAWKDVTGGTSLNNFKELTATAEAKINFNDLTEPGVYFLNNIKGNAFNSPDTKMKNCMLIVQGDINRDGTMSGAEPKLQQIVFPRGFGSYSGGIPTQYGVYLRAMLNSDTTSYGTWYNYIMPRRDQIEDGFDDLKNYHSSENMYTSNVIDSFISSYIVSARSTIKQNALNDLQTTDKSSLIAAINELNTRLAALENPTE